MHRRSVAIARVWTAATVLGVFACGDEAAAPEPDELDAATDDLDIDLQTPERASPEVEAFHHDADITDVTVYWAAAPQGVERTDALTLVLESHVDEPRLVSPRVLVSGLDDRVVETELPSVELGALDRREIEVRLDELPVQGVSRSVTLLASGTYEGMPEQTITVQAEPLGFHFDEGFGSAYAYTLDTMVTELGGGQLTEDPRDLRGRVMDGGVYVAVERDPDDTTIPAGLESIEFTYEITSDASEHGTASDLSASIEPEAAPDPGDGGSTGPLPDLPSPTCQFFPWNCCTGTNCVDVCADWTTTFVDASDFNASPREDHALGVATQTVDASYAEFEVTKFNCAGQLCYFTTVASGLLGPDGCAELDLTPGSGYSLKAKTRLQHGVGGNLYPVEHHTANDPATNVGVVTVSKSFNVPIPGSPLPPPMITLPQHQAANAAAAISRTLASGAAADQPIGFTTRSGLGCLNQNGVPASDACAGTSVKTGPYTKPDGSPGGLRWKFILAHEIGHVMQDKAMGQLWNPYCFTPTGAAATQCVEPNTPDHPDAPASCSCDHVSGSNGLHCLQSFERTSAAQLEGFAQFFAARVWNNTDNTCLFRYYKQFREDDGDVLQPPVNTSCSSYVNWRDNHCYSSWGGTEYDWLQFMWNLAIGSYKYSMHDIYEVYRGACTDGYCNSESPGWAALEASAAALFGQNSAKHLKFVNAGDAAGVDDSKF
jgi:hypothetical protein